VNIKLARLLVYMYPRAWKQRYGKEFEAMLQSESGGIRTAANVIRSAFYEHIFPTGGHKMDPQPRSFIAMTKQITAFVPVAMSLVALTLVLSNVAIYGVVRQSDEGTVAHIWQLLMAGQVPIVAFFAIKWLPRAPKQSLGVLAMQAGAGLASMAPVFFLHL
jgi:hypothetical protein